MSANEQMAAAEGLGYVPYTRPTGTDTAEMCIRDSFCRERSARYA